MHLCFQPLHISLSLTVAAAGSLVANAPHLPVHLGAMSEAVRFQVAYYGPGGPGQQEGLQVTHRGQLHAHLHDFLCGFLCATFRSLE